MNQSPDPPSDHDKIGAVRILQQQPDQGVNAIPFVVCARFTTFTVEYTVVNGDIIMHFFPSKEAHESPNAQKYWYQVFPEVLDPTARRYFDAGPDTLQACLTEDVLPSYVLPVEGVTTVDSWYLRAQGFGDRLDPTGFTERFFKTLDTALDAVKAM